MRKGVKVQMNNGPLSVCNCACLNLSYVGTLEPLTLHKDCLWPDIVSWFWPKVIGRKVHNSFLVHIFLMEEKWNLLLNTKNFYDLMTCHKFDSRSYVQVQGHWKKKCIRLPNINSTFNITSKYQTCKGEQTKFSNKWFFFHFY